MHDCPRCQIPLHGHESFCPVCGQQQRTRPEYELPTLGQKERTFNPLGLILIIVAAGALLFYAVQSSWIGQLIKRGPVAADETPLSQPAAREQLENSIIQNLAAQSATGKFVYKSGEKVVDRNYPQAVELTINTSMKDTHSRQSIIDPVKSLMVPAHINTLVFTANHSSATATYTVAGGGAEPTDETTAASPSNTDDAGSADQTAN